MVRRTDHRTWIRTDTYCLIVMARGDGPSLARQSIGPDRCTWPVNETTASWRWIWAKGKKGVWIKMPIEFANLVEIAVKEGFWYHHAEPYYLMLVHWIADSESTIPANASHKVSIGAIVFNHKREGESIFEGAIRELKEETGIDAEFLEVLAFRQIPNSFFNKSDLFFLCMMRPLSFDIQKQDLEIEAARWMAFDEYANQPLIQKDGLSKYIRDLCLAKAKGDYQGFTPIPITSSVIDDHMSSLYFLKDALHQ
ncbi:Nudix hydrolase 10 [Capsicum annuum]|nr:Nudix hydrolase 10 [Capsicum annuum]KAF3640661.1 Nudix hydrolase 10 [Capsicum annuum]